MPLTPAHRHRSTWYRAPGGWWSGPCRYTILSREPQALKETTPPPKEIDQKNSNKKLYLQNYRYNIKTTTSFKGEDVKPLDVQTIKTSVGKEYGQRQIRTYFSSDLSLFDLGAVPFKGTVRRTESRFAEHPLT